MKKIVSTVNMPYHTWIQERRKGVCGSESSVVLGINPHKSFLTLWQEKTNRIPIEESSLYGRFKINNNSRAVDNHIEIKYNVYTKVKYKRWL